MGIIARKSAPIQIIVHYPTDEAGWTELAHRVSSVHADAVNRQIQRLTCPTEQKLHLLNAVIKTAEEAGQTP